MSVMSNKNVLAARDGSSAAAVRSAAGCEKGNRVRVSASARRNQDGPEALDFRGASGENREKPAMGRLDSTSSQGIMSPCSAVELQAR